MQLTIIGRDAYLLDGGLNWTDIVGSAAEWRAIAAFIRCPNGRGPRLSQCSITMRGDGYLLRSLRSLSPSDAIAITRAEALALADTIGEQLRELEHRDLITLGA